MANNEIVEQDIETGMLSRSQTPERGIEEPSWSKPLEDALKRNNWDGVKEIMERVPEAINGPVGSYKDSPLVFALMEENDMCIIEYLINMTTPPQKLVYSQEEIDGSERTTPAIHWAACHRNYKAAKLLISKYPPMLNSLDYYKRTPIHLALLENKTEMACYMLKVGLSHVKDPQQEFDETAFTKDFEFAIKEKNYDFAYILIHHFPNLANHESPWKMLIELYDNFPCRSRLNFFQSTIYSWIHVDSPLAVMDSFTPEWEKAHFIHYSRTKDSVKQSLQVHHVMLQRHADWKVLKRSAHRIVRSFIQFLLIKNMRKLKSRRERALGFVRSLCVGIPNLTFKDRLKLIYPAYYSAVQNGMSDIVEEILPHFPALIKHTDEDGNNALQFTASHRDGKLFHVLHQRIKGYEYLLESKDVKGNNILHLVANRAQRNRLDTGSREVLQLQREFQWYKEMEKLLPFDLKFNKNLDGKVPLEVFDDEHKDMLKSESEWITSMANSCIVGGSLIAAVVFAAAITLPGGNNEIGHPIFSKERAFKVFTFSDAFALISSLTTVVTFLSIFTTRYSVESFQYDLPSRMIIGIISFLFSVTFMMIAFCATAYLLFVEDYNWIIYPAAALSFVPVFFFSYFQLPSLLNIIKSTYGHSIFKEGKATKSSKEGR